MSEKRNKVIKSILLIMFTILLLPILVILEVAKKS